MQTKTLVCFFIAALSGLFAQVPTYKVAVIGMQNAIAGTKAGQKASKELAAKVQPKQKEFDQRQTEVAQLEDQLNKGTSVLSKDKRTQLARDIGQKKTLLERDMSDARESFTAEQQRILQTLGQRMLALVEKYAKENGYTLVLDVSSADTPILYADPATDITPELIAQFDKPE